MKIDYAELLGPMMAEAWVEDPRRLSFTFARYKFVAKMFTGLKNVLEVGANTGFSSAIVRQAVESLTLCDKKGTLAVLEVDYTIGFVDEGFDGVYALDVLEHVEDEDSFMRNICNSLTPEGSCIIGMPSLESQPYASHNSKREHVNCKTEEGLRSLMKKYFKNVYLFGMNDETLHTGFGPMCHYRLALANTKRWG